MSSDLCPSTSGSCSPIIRVHLWFLQPQSRRCPEADRRGQPLQSGALNAKNVPESTICGVVPIGQPLQVVYFGWSGFPFPEAPLAGQSEPQSTPFSAEALS